MATVHAKQDIMLSLQRALLGAIRQNYRAICYEYDGKSGTMLIRCYCEQEPNETDREVMSIVGAEVYADFPDMNSIAEELVVADQSIGRLSALDGFVYARQEE